MVKSSYKNPGFCSTKLTINIKSANKYSNSCNCSHHYSHILIIIHYGGGGGVKLCPNLRYQYGNTLLRITTTRYNLTLPSWWSHILVLFGNVYYQFAKGPSINCVTQKSRFSRPSLPPFNMCNLGTISLEPKPSPLPPLALRNLWTYPK